MSSSHSDFMQRAFDLVVETLHNNGAKPFGSVVVKGTEIVGCGIDLTKLDKDPTAHAEVVAIRDACSKLNTLDLSSCTLYTNCEPSALSFSAILEAKISKVYFAATKEDAAYFGFDLGKGYEEVAKPLEKREVILRNISRDEAFDVFEKHAEVSA